MDEMLKDARFAHIPRDPAFKRIPKQERKVKIDKRFQSMFNDKKFKVKYTIDKRGRPMRNSSTENLRRYYELDSSNESGETSDEDSEGESLNKPVVRSKLNKNQSNKKEHDDADVKITERKVGKLKKEGNVENNSKKISSLQLSSNVQLEISEDDDEEEEDDKDNDSDFDGKGNDKLESNNQSFDEKLRSRLQDMSVDYARGEGIILSDSSSDEESSDDEEDEDDEEAIGWGQLDEDAERTDESTNRLAVCNMDWDRITARDLLVLLHSFVPKGGLILSVTIYPSEFGLQRLKEEEEKGPLELRAEDAVVANSDTDEDEKEKKKRIHRDDDEEEEGSEYQREKLRQYQLKRLRYFYAVVVCDSVSTADALYKECDGMEYESSASHLDLRFIPDDVTFDQEPKETCTELPNMTKYEPQLFITTALQQSKVRLTWDETDPRRNKINEKINAGKVEEIDDHDLKAYLATSSEGESSEEEESQEVAKKEKNMEMEVTWGFDLNEKVKKRMKDGKAEEMTPFQKYLERRKEKRKAKREEQLKKKQQQRKEQKESGDESEEGSVSEDDVPSDIDMNDEYFKEEFEKEEFAQAEKAKSKKKKNKKKKDGHESEDEESKKKKAELELLLMDEEDNKKHFSLKDILIEDSDSKKKKKKKNKKQLEEKSAEKKDDDFQINVQDQRFSAIFTSHLYNIDPADPHYKKTKGMEALRQEKLSRRTLDEELPRKKQKIETPEKKKDAELSLLVKNVKRKTQTLKK
ncbi:ESF1 like protein [Gryllus bimaculatus]|nr:ESF1 like protein [Gryllus bimaculatus]